MPYQAGVPRFGCFRAYAFLAPISLLATVSTAFSQAFTVTLEAPKVQQSYLTANPSGFGATNVFTEIFDELPAGFKQTSTPFEGKSAIGSYDKLLIRPADQFGGAGGTGSLQRRFLVLSVL
jgi:hypothetical protein